MDVTERGSIRAFIQTLLRERDVENALDDSDSLFASGWLDSLGAVEVVEFMEQQFSINVAAQQFSIDRIDSVDAIANFVDSARG